MRTPETRTSSSTPSASVRVVSRSELRLRGGRLASAGSTAASSARADCGVVHRGADEIQHQLDAFSLAIPIWASTNSMNTLV
jgi:hypothetical protein